MENALDWKRRVLAATSCPCGDCDGVPQGHHVVTQQQLRKHGLIKFIWDTDNGMTLCERAHRRHHSGRTRVRRQDIPSKAEAFAHRHGLTWILDRYYV